MTRSTKIVPQQTPPGPPSGDLLLQIDPLPWEWLNIAVDAANVLRRIQIVIGMLVLIFVLLAVTDQGMDILRSFYADAFTQPGDWIQFGSFHAAIALLALEMWSMARSLLLVSPVHFTNYERSLRFQSIIPRILAALVPLLAVCGLLRAEVFPGIRGRALLIAILFNGAISALLLLALWGRRQYYRDRLLKPSAAGQRITQEAFWFHWGAEAIVAFFPVIFTIVFLLSPVAFPRLLGAGTILLLGLATWAGLGFWVVYVDRRWFVPIFPVLVVILFLASYVNNNHRVRLADETKNLPPRHLTEYANNWMEGRREDKPVYLIAAEGGGIRAAYFSAFLLAAIEEAHPGFTQNIFMLSGVSGGALGTATIVALERSVRQKQIRSRTEAVRRFLGESYLAPVTATLMYPDFLQRFIPWPVECFDRSRAMEKAWERSWPSSDEMTPFGLTFDSLYPGKSSDHARNGGALPLLFLNATEVESGKRVVMCPVRIHGRYTDAIDARHAYSSFPSWRLSTIVLMSARFPYVTPSARICEDDRSFWCKPQRHLVDGGYFENSGAGTVLDVWRHVGGRLGRNVHIIVLRNGIEDAKPDRGPLYEIRHPIDAIMKTREARVPYTIALLNGMIGQRNVTILTLPFDGKSVPIGWELSADARMRIERFVKALIDPLSENKDEFGNLCSQHQALMAAIGTKVQLPCQ